MAKNFYVDNVDKATHHHDLVQPKGLIPYFPSKIIIAGRSNVGKSSTAKKLALTHSPPFQNIILVHYEKSSKEYDDLDPSAKYSAQELPEDPIEYLDPKEKNLMIMDEIDFVGMDKKTRGKLDRLFQYQATHKSMSIICVQQEFVSIPVSIRRACNWWVIYPNRDLVAQRDIASKTGYNLRELAKKYCFDKYQFLTFDNSGDGPPLRFGLFQPIETSEFS